MCRSRPRFGLVLATLLASAGALAVACGGQSTSPTANDGGGGGPGADSGAADAGGGGTIGPRAAGCPSALPAQDTACTKDGLLCEYGDDFNPLCNTVVVCSGTRWASPVYPGGVGPGDKKCGSPPPNPGPNPSACPASADASGQSCGAGGTVCNYPGKQCTCQIDCPQYPVGHDCPDAGTTWVCRARVDTCATPRPAVGSPCSAAQEGQTCGLADPTECGQEQLECSKGTWTLRTVSCPISTATAKTGIHYLNDDELAQLKSATLATKLATYRYKEGDESPHLGFIIEDQPPGSPAVTESRRHVDVYGYVSMTVAALQAQEREIAALRDEVRSLKKTCGKAEPVRSRK